eukprot:334602-Pleurochrysis_carterae.AAC.2
MCSRARLGILQQCEPEREWMQGEGEAARQIALEKLIRNSRLSQAPSVLNACAGCESNPFYTIYPYLFIFISLALACISLYLLAVGLTKFEALYMITVFEVRRTVYATVL